MFDPPYYSSVLILSSYLRQGRPNGLFPTGILIEILHTFLISSMCTTRPAHLNLLCLNIFIILGEIYTLWRLHF
jgi:hypothetical protein